MLIRLTIHRVGASVWMGGVVCGALLVAGLAGCAPQILPLRPTLYEVDARLDPESHRLSGRTVMHLTRMSPEQRPPDRAAVEVKLHRDLAVSSINVDGATLVGQSSSLANHPSTEPAIHRLVLSDIGDKLRITMDYAGELRQNVSAGEKSGEIHNFMMSAHIGSDGIYLSDDGYWHPAPAFPDDADPADTLADFRLTTDPIQGFELVAALERQPDGSDGRWHWVSAYPQPRITLIGGPLRRWTRQHGPVTLHAVLAPDKEAVAEDILTLSADLLDRYQPLLGPYPFKEFTVLEAFFSSGFAFPGCTQIVGSQLSVFKQYRRHGYIDHEMVHSWWGCGVYVDPRFGNWCESLTSYCANYYGHVLDGNEKGARDERRNQSNFLSSITPDKDKPLSTYGQDDGAGRGLAYQKGAAVFHMLERKVGAAATFAALRRLTSECVGKHAAWHHVQEAFEAESGADLKPFFDQWVYGAGAPLLELTGADWSPGSDRLAVWISQGATEFELDVPLRLYYGERAVDTVAIIAGRKEQVWVPCETSGLTAVELDPDYHLFRKLKPGEIMPTSAMTRRSKDLLIVLPEGELAEGYRTAIDGVTEAVKGTKDEPNEGAQVRTMTAGQVTANDLAAADLFIVGEAVHAPLVGDLLGRTVSPVVWNEAGFEIGGEAYADASQAVFFTVHHPEKENAAITVYYGNSEEALSNARVLNYYPNSLLVFHTPPGDDGADASGHPHTEVIRRMDFEFHDRIEF